MTPQSLFQFGAVTLHPTPDRRVIRRQTALCEQLFDIAERERVPEIPAHGTQNQLWRRLPPLEDCRSGCVLHDRFSLPASPAKVATHPTGAIIEGTLDIKDYETAFNDGMRDLLGIVPSNPREGCGGI